MRKLSLLPLVNQYIDDEKRRRGKTLSKSTIYQWIEGDVEDEITLIYEEFNLIVKNNDKEARIIFEDSIKAQFKTNYFQDFLLNKSKPTRAYYKKFLEECSISEDAIKGFFKPESRSNPKTLDFFTAFCKNQEREYGKKESIYIPQTKNPEIPNDVKTETLEISGATIINKEFSEEIKKKEFSMAEFYTAKQNDNCQWYGVLKNYDIERKACIKIKEILKTCFTEITKPKIVAILHGDGGCGKSTILRRTAVDLYKNEDFKVLWLNENSFNKFIPSGLKTIYKKQNTQFLLIIEDWSKIEENYDEQSLKTFLSDTDSIDNLRIIIGDRKLRKKCVDHFVGTKKDTIRIDSSENEEIIQRILDNNPAWKETSQHFFDDKNSYQLTLFLLLFVIARTNHDKFNNSNINLKEPRKAFVEIIEYDLESIRKKYKGLAKALYYWGNIYSDRKFSISYKTFLKIADFYNGNKKVSHDFSNLNWQSSTHEKLRVYINESSEGFIQFNHDLLADSGLSEVSLEDTEFNDLTKLELLNFIVDYGDDNSASVFLGNTLVFDPKLLTKEEQVNLIHRLLLKNNLDDYYISKISDIDSSDDKLNYYQSLILNKKINHLNFIKIYLAKRPSDKLVNERYEKIIFFQLTICSIPIQSYRAVQREYLTHPLWKELTPHEKRKVLKGSLSNLMCYVEKIFDQIDHNIFKTNNHL